MRVCVSVSYIEESLRPAELLRQSWLGRITHTQSKTEHCVLERALPTELLVVLRQLSWLGRITHTQSKTEPSIIHIHYTPGVYPHGS